MASEDKGPLLNDDEEYDITRSMTPQVGEAEYDLEKKKWRLRHALLQTGIQGFLYSML